jgi:hypothetical protein
MFDCIAQETSDHTQELKQLKNTICNTLCLEADDLATMYQYFSQFLGMDKDILTKLKK